MSMLAPAPGGVKSELISIYQGQRFLKLFFETYFFFILSLTCCIEQYSNQKDECNSFHISLF